MDTRKYRVSPGFYPNKNSGKGVIVNPGNNTFGSFGFSQQPYNKANQKKGGCSCGQPKVVKKNKY
jgi:hypothetical protein